MGKRIKEPPPIDRGWAWMIVVGVFVQVFCLIGIAKSMGLIVMELVKKFNISIAEAVLPATVLFTTYAATSPAALILGEMTSPRIVVVLGSVLGFLGMSLASLLFNVTFYTIFFGASIGLGGACFYGNGLLLLGQYFRRHRSVANGLSLSGASVGQFVMPVVIEYLLETYGLSGATLISAAIFLHGAISGCLFRSIESYDVTVGTDKALQNNNAEEGRDPGPHISDNDGHLESHELLENETSLPDRQSDNNLNDIEETDQIHFIQMENGSVELIHEIGQSTLLPEQNNSNNVQSNNKNATNASKNEGFLKRLRKTLDFRVLKNYVTLFYTTVSFLCFSGYMNVVLFLPPIFTERRMDRRTTANLLSVSGAGELVARVGMGFIADRNFVPRYTIMGSACILSGLNVFMMLFADTFPWAAVHSFFYGFTGGTYISLSVVVLVDFVGLSELSRNLVIILFIQGVGSALGQPILGALRDSSGSCDIILYICSISSVLGGTLLFAYPLIRKWESRRPGQKQKVTT